VPDAASYDVLRSILPGGGYEVVGTTAEPSFSDATVRNGTRYHYVVVARDAAGNPSPRSAEATVLPELALEDARLEEPAEVSQPLSAVEAGTPIRALVRAPGTEAPGPVVGIRAQLGVGTADGDPAADYAWSEMTFVEDADDADRLAGTVRPEEIGSFNVVLRVSTDDGRTWAYADRGGIVTAAGALWTYRPDQAVTLATTPAADTEPPPAPGAPTVVTVAGSSLTLAWDTVAAPDLYRYEVERRTEPGGGAFERIGTATEPRFTDDTIAAGTTYVYVVRAVDTSFNRSAPSGETSTSAETRDIAVTFTVSLPANTPAGDTIFIAGDFQGWDPGATPMTKVDDRTWTITLPFTEGDTPQYKYTRGSWEAVEKDAGCGEIPNRTVQVTYGTDGTQQVGDTVEKWRDVDQCG
jgi:chitodextrinase